MCDMDCENLIDLNETRNPETQNLHIAAKKVIAEDILTHSVVDGVFASPLQAGSDRLGKDPFDDILEQTDQRNDPFELLEREARLKAMQLNEDPMEGNLLFLDNTQSNTGSSINLETENPAMAFTETLFCDSGVRTSGADSDSATGSSAETSESFKLKKGLEYRKRLLKSNLSKTICSSPMVKKLSLDEQELLSTPTSSNLSKGSHFGEPLLSAESPLKLIDDDMIPEGPEKQMDTDELFEADLEMLKIHMLDKLPTLEQGKSVNLVEINNEGIENTKEFIGLPDLEAIKEKLKVKREEDNTYQRNINSLIVDLKSLIINEGVTDEDKKRKAAHLLETLSSALTHSQEAEEHKDSMENVPSTLSALKRQGTFDIELEEDKQNIEQPLISEMADSMISSSGTYDGETNGEQTALKLPEIAPLSPARLSEGSPVPTPLSKQNDNNVNDVVEQISKILEQTNNGGNLQNNPTFIVVMNTPRAQKSDSTPPGNISFHDLSPGPRKRAQSLSLYDQVKIVQLPLKSRTPDSKQSERISSISTTPPIKDEERKSFKTPNRVIRRNSFSNNASRASDTALLKPTPSSDGKPSKYVRRIQTMETHREGVQQQQQAIVKPMFLSKHSMPKFKPDLRKRSKPNGESIMKSSAPLKATLPVKKVTSLTKPNIVITPDQSLKSEANPSILHVNTSSYLTPKPTGLSVSNIGYPKASSTPAVLISPIKRNTNLSKSRNARLSVLPNSKSSTLSTKSDLNTLRRRTISEFKAKSPLKSKLNGVSANSARPSMGVPRLPTVKLNNKLTATGTISKTTNRSGPRASVSGTVSRNKENKRP